VHACIRHLQAPPPHYLLSWHARQQQQERPLASKHHGVFHILARHSLASRLSTRRSSFLPTERAAKNRTGSIAHLRASAVTSGAASRRRRRRLAQPPAGSSLSLPVAHFAEYPNHKILFILSKEHLTVLLEREQTTLHGPTRSSRAARQEGGGRVIVQADVAIRTEWMRRGTVESSSRPRRARLRSRTCSRAGSRRSRARTSRSTGR
jgi:hypothetical protein